MAKERSINGPVISSQTLLMRGHPSTNPTLQFHDQKFESLCLDMGVPKYQLDKDRMFKIGRRIDVTPTPEMDFDLEGMNDPTVVPEPGRNM